MRYLLLLSMFWGCHAYPQSREVSFFVEDQSTKYERVCTIKPTAYKALAVFTEGVIAFFQWLGELVLGFSQDAPLTPVEADIFSKRIQADLDKNHNGQYKLVCKDYYIYEYSSSITIDAGERGFKPRKKL